MGQREKMRTYTCDICGIAFFNKDELDTHVSRQHGADAGAPDPTKT